jgi:hypothetical protein
MDRTTAEPVHPNSTEEVMFVGARPGANLPHSRYYCPNNKFTPPQTLDKPQGNNASYCKVKKENARCNKGGEERVKEK